MRFLSFKSLSISRPNASCIIWKVKSEPFVVVVVDEDDIGLVANVVVAGALVVGNEEYDWDDCGDAAIPPPLEAI